jgi:hypothetical protein
MAALCLTRHTAHCLRGGGATASNAMTGCGPQLAYRRRREQGLSPRPAVHFQRPQPNAPRTPAGRASLLAYARLAYARLALPTHAASAAAIHDIAALSEPARRCIYRYIVGNRRSTYTPSRLLPQRRPRCCQRHESVARRDRLRRGHSMQQEAPSKPPHVCIAARLYITASCLWRGGLCSRIQRAHAAPLRPRPPSSASALPTSAPLLCPSPRRGAPLHPASLPCGSVPHMHAHCPLAPPPHPNATQKPSEAVSIVHKAHGCLSLSLSLSLTGP